MAENEGEKEWAKNWEGLGDFALIRAPADRGSRPSGANRGLAEAF
jgi:hypothetical protein